ncbi:MAG: hypothetical protein LC667_07565 [Thioalkalivibrio sp.]|nr:hypothetical protein [Thioalkalivibrio sp.]
MTVTGAAGDSAPAWARELSSAPATLDDVTSYLLNAMAAFGPDRRPESAGGNGATDERVFGLLTHRRFSYLGRTKAARYRERVMPSIQEDIAHGRPVHFFFDIGPGYHASPEPDAAGLSFDVGLAELLMLRQVVLFEAAVQAHYPPGVRFSLVVDNLCGLFTNSVPLAATHGYVRALRALIDELGVGTVADLLVESECSNETEYAAAFEAVAPQTPRDDLGDDDLENVARFLGRACTPTEAADRVERYRRAGTATEVLLAPVIRGVRLTQRASAATLAFRSFPGGAQRMQVGEIVLEQADGAPPRPTLLTSRNRAAYELARIALPGVLPPSVSHVGVARRRADPEIA